MTTTLTVANTILEQLGGNRFLAMTGAKNLLGGENFLAFGLPGTMTTKGINKVRITLNGFDTYDVEGFKIRGTRVEPIAFRQDVHAENLRETFTRMTGLDTHL
jgi:hypothetical protein